MDSDYSEEAYASSSAEDASMLSSDDDYAFDNAAAQFSSKSKVGWGCLRSVRRFRLQQPPGAGLVREPVGPGCLRIAWRGCARARA
jgi:hypothetical protein